ncbi:MAG: PBP1A family penicillin-binding protein [Terrimicrobiaceae bacterium]
MTLLLWAVVGLGFYAWALTFDLKAIAQMPERSSVYDKDGNFYSRLAGENRVVVPFDRVSNDFINALLAREDTRFYRHKGIDPIGIFRAVIRNFIAGGFREGASTITQQLARNSFPLGGKNLVRKLIEAALAYRIETELTKEEILEAYVNRIYFGSGYYGVEAASQSYFGKPASRMNLPEAAMLAGLIRSPNRISPFNNLPRAIRERDMVLTRMKKVRLITSSQYQAAVNSPPRIAKKPSSSPQDNWAMESILRELDLVLDREEVNSGGLQIYSTIDPALQKIAEASVARRLNEVEARPGYPHPPKSRFNSADLAEEDSVPYLEAAAMAMDSSTGAIRAIVGGRDLQSSRFNRAISGRRQVGSAVKPFVYAEAFERGLSPKSRISDNRIGPAELPRSFGRYDPANSDNTYRGDLPVSEGLVLSRNTMSVRVGITAGLDHVAEKIQLSGMAADPPRLPAVCLGAFESNLRDLTAAYTAFANDGVKLQPFLIDRVLDDQGQVLYRATKGSIRVFSPKTATVTTSIMQDVLTRGTAGSAGRLGYRKRGAGKTGTTNDYRDAWFVGFDSDLTCGVWVGFDLPRKIQTGGSGANLALPIWVDIMR